MRGVEAEAAKKADTFQQFLLCVEQTGPKLIRLAVTLPSGTVRPRQTGRLNPWRRPMVATHRSRLAACDAGRLINPLLDRLVSHRANSHHPHIRTHLFIWLPRFMSSLLSYNID